MRRAARGTAAVLVALALASCGGGGGSGASEPGPSPGASSVGGTGHAESAPVEIAAAEPGEPPAGREPTAAELRAVEPLMRAAEEVRGLRFTRPVPLRVQTAEEITAFVASTIDPEELARAHTFYVALGLLEADLDIRQLLLDVMGEQVAGYYDPERGMMVVRDDVVAELGAHGMDGAEAAMTLVHEYVHALQDQALGLGEHFRDERTIDADNAFASLVEGDATLAMVGLLALGSGGDLRRLTTNLELLDTLMSPDTAMSSGGEELAAAPAIVRLPLVSRYLEGMRFCAYLHGGTGTGGWPAIDGAFSRMPISTEQILHPESYPIDPPIEITLPSLPMLEERGFVAHDEDTLGELEMSIYLGQGTDDERDERAAAGWGGDRLRVYVRGSETAAVWATVWDSAEDAAEAARSFLRVRRMIPEPRRAWHNVRRHGRVVVALRDVPASLHDSVREALDAAADAALAVP